MDEILCIIPARGESKGIYRKNERLLNNKSLVAYSIEHAILANIPLKNIVVSSDASSILDIARQYNIIAHQRPDEISGGDCSTESAMVDVLDSHYVDAHNIMLLQPTSPIRFQNTISNCIVAYLNGNHDSLLTVTKFHNFFWTEESKTYRSLDDPIRWKWTPSYIPQKRPMRQDLRRQDYRYFENGNLYITHSDILRNTGCRIGENPCIYPISELESIQIDTQEDLRIVNAILSGKVLTL